MEWLAPIIVCAVFYGSYWASASSEAAQNFFTAHYKGDKALVFHVLYQKFCGLIFLGLLPAVMMLLFTEFRLSEFGVNAGRLSVSLRWVSVLGGIIFIANIFLAKRESNLKQYPQIRARRWRLTTLFAAGAGWLMYLLGYEFLFRGILLFGCLRVMGTIPALLINVCIYALVHIPKGKTETLGSVPFGLLVCWLSISTGNIWAAFGLHAVMALSNLYLSFYYHKDMYLIRKR